MDTTFMVCELFRVLRVLADRPRRPARFLVLGSASPGLLRQGSETLAGRIAYHELHGFSLEEVGPRNHVLLGIQVPSTTMRRFWTMLAHSHGQAWNASDFARSFGVADTTVRKYLDHLTA